MRRTAKTAAPKRAVVRRASTRAVPVAMALKSLIPAAPVTIQSVMPVSAASIHQPVMKTGPTPAIQSNAPVAPLELTASRAHRWPAFGVMTAVVGVMALAFLVRPQSGNHSIAGGRILGLETDQPLRVTLIVDRPSGESTVTTAVTTGTLAEALGRASSVLGGSFSYVSRGSSIYLSGFSGLANGANGHWEVRLNGAAVNDLSQVSLSQGDRINLAWQ